MLDSGKWNVIDFGFCAWARRESGFERGYEMEFWGDSGFRDWEYFNMHVFYRTAEEVQFHLRQCKDDMDARKRNRERSDPFLGSLAGGGLVMLSVCVVEFSFLFFSFTLVFFSFFFFFKLILLNNHITCITNHVP